MNVAIIIIIKTLCVIIFALYLGCKAVLETLLLVKIIREVWSRGEQLLLNG